MPEMTQTQTPVSGLVPDRESPDYLGTGTYSPEDNKLRLYPFARLSREDYQRVRDAGFIWAPKQELFVAPMWTPARAELLARLCGGIEDEDDSLMQRAEDRADRFEGYSERRGQEADAARRQVEAVAGRFEMGQPILVGHHSERRARKDKERIDNGMRKAVKLWDTRDYWARRAEAAKAHAAYKQDPQVRFRRLKGIEADLRKAVKIVEDAQRFLKLWQTEGLTQAQAVAIANRDSVRVVEAGNSWGSGAWDMLTRENNPRSLAEVVELAERFHRGRISAQEPWIAHYEHRIAYERAMLGEGGGLVAEAFELQAGGQVLIGGTWLTVVRVNKKDGRPVSVTTNARYVRVRGVEEITEYKAPSEEQAATVSKAKKLPPLVNYPHSGATEMTKAEWDRTHKDYKGTREHGQGARSRGYGRAELADQAESAFGLHRVRVVVRAGSLKSVFITDAKVTQPPAADAQAGARAALPAPVPVGRTVPVVEHEKAERDGAESIEAMRSALRSGGAAVAVAPQLFPTPPDLAARMVREAQPEIGSRVLEPSAGTGNLLRALPGVLPFGEGNRQTACYVVAVEINVGLSSALFREGLAHHVENRDFLELSAVELGGLFDVVLMNPPFANAADIAHIRHALGMLKPGGRLVAICANGPRQVEALQPLAEASGGFYEPQPEGTFREAGTNVRVALVVIHKPE